MIVSPSFRLFLTLYFFLLFTHSWRVGATVGDILMYEDDQRTRYGGVAPLIVVLTGWWGWWCEK